jgi:hypothetical protein
MMRSSSRVVLSFSASDLNEPVNALITALEVVRLACKDNPEAIRALERADRQAQILCELADALRDGPFPFAALPAEPAAL